MWFFWKWMWNLPELCHWSQSRWGWLVHATICVLTCSKLKSGFPQTPSKLTQSPFHKASVVAMMASSAYYWSATLMSASIISLRRTICLYKYCFFPCTGPCNGTPCGPRARKWRCLSRRWQASVGVVGTRWGLSSAHLNLPVPNHATTHGDYTLPHSTHTRNSHYLFGRRRAHLHEIRWKWSPYLCQQKWSVLLRALLCKRDGGGKNTLQRLFLEWLESQRG